MIVNTIKNLSKLSKVLLGTTAVLGTATTVMAVKDIKASKAAAEVEAPETEEAEADVVEADESAAE